MVSLRTAKELREFLKLFNDDCEIGIIVDGKRFPIGDYSWSDKTGDSPYESTEQSMHKATELNLYPHKENEK